MAADPQAVWRALNRLAGDLPALGVAVSGGGDSTALLHMVRAWAGDRRVLAATVDHGLRDDSAAEALVAGRAAAALGVPHQVLRWTGPTGGNLMAEARKARLALLADWACQHDLPAVALGHTRDDQAETVLLRVMRGAGVDGLSGMADARTAHGIVWLRPLLDVGRADLRDWLRMRDIAWIDDPSNDNPAFDRIRVRQAIATLGLSNAALARTATDMRMAREALDHAARDVAAGCRAIHGTLHLPQARFAAAPTELRRRLIAAGLRWVTGADYSPRRDAVMHLLDEIAAHRQATLDGVIVTPGAQDIRLIREPAAAARASDANGDPAFWDRRWRLTGLPTNAVVRALNSADLPRFDWRNTGLSRDEAAATPAVHLPGGIVVAPVIAPEFGVTATILRGADMFLLSLSH